MKKLLTLMLLMLLVLPAAALAETAEDITLECLVNKQAYKEKSPDKCRDEDYGTFYSGKTLTIQAPEGKTIGSVLLKWRTISPPAVIIKTEQNGKWVEVLRDGPNYASQYIVLPEGLECISVSAKSGKVEFCEITVLTPGEAPSYVQIWRDPPEKVDLMLFSTHPDDEVLWFGGLLPYYAGELDKDVLVVNAVFGWYYRRHELLSSLWTCGVDIYPIMLGYPDQKDPVNEILKEWSLKKRQPKEKAVELIRQYKPDVVVLHDKNGEYGHPAHILFSQLGRQGVERAAVATEHKTSAEKWGVWDVPKTYIHLWEENQLRMDWKQPLTAFDGMTGLEVAHEALQWHKSQLSGGWAIEDGGEYDNALFGLWRTTVGPDVEKNDLFENIPAE